jgi:hypothetical protein|tara:strand:- start:512 stop:1225 length:714 start_codon:yes stop_codon:yes gene_type:complete
MNKVLTYFLKKQEILTMGYKFIKTIFILFFIFHYNVLFSKIIYDKDNILISENEIALFQSLYKDYKGLNINKNIAIKKIVLQKKVLKKFLESQKEYIDNLDSQIIEQNGEEILNNRTKLNFVRYVKIQNDVIYDYFNTEFKIEDLEIILKEFTEIKLAISNNNCLTILKQQDFKNDINFINNLFNELKNISRDYNFKIGDKNYEICINDKFYQIINKKITRYIELKTEYKMKNFAYK